MNILHKIALPMAFVLVATSFVALESFWAAENEVDERTLLDLSKSDNQILESGVVWFDDLVGAQPPDTEEVRQIVVWLRDNLLDGDFREAPQLADTLPRMLFLTLGDGQETGVVLQAGGNSLTQAAEQALALASARQGKHEWSLLKLDIVDQIAAPQRVTPRGRLEFERGLNGIAFEHRWGLAFLPEEVVTRTLVTSEREIRASNVAKYLRALDLPTPVRSDQLWSDGKMSVRAFTTRSYFADRNKIFPLYRGHREQRREQTEDMLYAAIQAGDYLRRAVEDNGSFVYSYLAKTNKEKHAYNILRHAGTAYSMLELYEVTGDAQLLVAAERALEYLRAKIVECRAGRERASCVEENGEVKLGGNALGILALAKHARVTGDRSGLPLMVRLANWITGTQALSGEFLIHKRDLETEQVDDLVSQYYPGEALFALTRLFELDGDGAWIDAAQRGARWLITVRDGDLSDNELSHDHWLLYALNDLNRTNQDPIFVEHALRLARVIASSQNRQPAFPDWRGSYYRPP